VRGGAGREGEGKEMVSRCFPRLMRPNTIVVELRSVRLAAHE
jgi:hypothetical protein